MRREGEIEEVLGREDGRSVRLEARAASRGVRGVRTRSGRAGSRWAFSMKRYQGPTLVAYAAKIR